MKLCNKLCNCSVRNIYIYIYRNVKPEFLIFILNKLKCSFKSYRYNKKFINLSEVQTFKVFCTYLQCNGRPTTKIVVYPAISVRLLMGCTKYTHINNYTGCKWQKEAYFEEMSWVENFSSILKLGKIASEYLSDVLNIWCCKFNKMKKLC